MLIRIVRMTFQEELIGEFLEIFHHSQDQIRLFDGCLHLELWQDYYQPNVYLTYSHWETEAALNHYRQSALFTETWAKTKILFAEKPQVFSIKKAGEYN